MTEKQLMILRKTLGQILAQNLEQRLTKELANGILFSVEEAFHDRPSDAEGG